jgi:hypothetical protein
MLRFNFTKSVSYWSFLNGDGDIIWGRKFLPVFAGFLITSLSRPGTHAFGHNTGQGIE